MHNEAVQIIIILLTFAFLAFQPLFMNHPEIRADQPSAVLVKLSTVNAMQP